MPRWSYWLAIPVWLDIEAAFLSVGLEPPRDEDPDSELMPREVDAFDRLNIIAKWQQQDKAAGGLPAQANLPPKTWAKFFERVGLDMPNEMWDLILPKGSMRGPRPPSNVESRPARWGYWRASPLWTDAQAAFLSFGLEPMTSLEESNLSYMEDDDAVPDQWKDAIDRLSVIGEWRKRGEYHGGPPEISGADGLPPKIWAMFLKRVFAHVADEIDELAEPAEFKIGTKVIGYLGLTSSTRWEYWLSLPNWAPTEAAYLSVGIDPLTEEEEHELRSLCPQEADIPTAWKNSRDRLKVIQAWLRENDASIAQVEPARYVKLFEQRSWGFPAELFYLLPEYRSAGWPPPWKVPAWKWPWTTPNDQTKAPNALDSSLEQHSKKLAAAIKAWGAIRAMEDLGIGTSVKQVIEKWLTGHAEELGLINRDGTVNATGIKEIAKVVNWETDGGSPKTPHR